MIEKNVWNKIKDYMNISKKDEFFIRFIELFNYKNLKK